MADHTEEDAKWEAWKVGLERDRDARRFYAEQSTELFVMAMQASKEFAVMALRTAVFINGGAGVALLAFIGSTVEAETAFTIIEVRWSLLAFALGLVSASVGMLAGYLNYQYFADDYPWPARLANNMVVLEAKWPQHKVPYVGIMATRWIGIVAGVASYLSFVAGCAFLAVILS